MNDRLWSKFEYLILCSLIILLPSYIYTGVKGPTIIPKVLLTNYCACLLLLSWCIRRIFCKGTFRFSFIPVTFILFGLYLGLEIYFSNHPQRAFRASLHYLSPLALGLYSYAHIRTEKKRRFILLLVVVGALPVALYAILQSYGQDFIGWERMTEERRRIGSFLGNPSYLGDYLAVVFVLLMGRIAILRRKKFLIPAIVYAALLLFTILRTQSRGPWLLVLFGGLLLALMIYRPRKADSMLISKKIVFTSILLILIVVLVAGLLARNGDFNFLVNRFKQGLRLQGVSVQMRLALWEVSRQIWLDHPWFGVGIHNYRVDYLDYLYELLVDNSDTFGMFQRKTQIIQANHGHNDYLQVLAEWGAAGYSLLLLVFISCAVAISRGIRLEKDDDSIPTFNRTAFSLITGLLCFALSAFYAFPLQLPTSCFMIFLLLGMMGGYETEWRKGPPRNSSRILAAALLILIAVPTGHALHVSWKTLRGEINVLHALSLNYKGDYESELKYLQKAFYDMPENGELLFNIGNAHLAQSNLQEARRFYQLSEKTYNNPSLLMNQALVDLDMKRYDQLENKLDRLSVLVPNLPQIHYILGMRHYLEGDLEMAIYEFEQELRQEPNHLKANLYLGQSLLLLERYREAERALKEAVRLGPRNMAAHEILGDLYHEQLNMPSQAAIEYTVALRAAEITGNRRAAFRISRKLDRVKSLLEN